MKMERCIKKWDYDNDKKNEWQVMTMSDIILNSWRHIELSSCRVSVFFEVIDLGHNIREEQVRSFDNVWNHLKFLKSYRVGELAS